MYRVNIETEDYFWGIFNYLGKALQKKKQEYESNYIFIDIFFCNNTTEIYIPFILPFSTLLTR